MNSLPLRNENTLKMKFVIKSLLFVNLILQITSSLRKCFDQDQNLMLTIILIVFSLIGLIGLFIGNRFILIIFAACMTLILIASITIYTIGNTEQDPMQPKVPYYTSGPSNSNQAASFERGSPRRKEPSKIKSLVGRVFGRVPLRPGMRQNKTLPGPRSSSFNRAEQSPGFISTYLDDTDDPSMDARLEQLNAVSPSTRLGALDHPEGDLAKMKNIDSKPSSYADSQQQDSSNDLNLVRSEQWVAYEHLLYERYLNIVSQSVDLVLQTILASWMALLLDEDSDQCFGNKPARLDRVRLQSDLRRKEDPVYNYNGVRYSIRPDSTNESPSRVLVR